MSIKITDLLIEIEKKSLQEIGEGNAKPFPWQRRLYSVGKNFLTIFLAPKDIPDNDKIPEVEVYFSQAKDKEYKVGFDINNIDIQAFKSSSSYYLRIMATIVEIIKTFIKQEDPKTLIIKGIDKEDVKIPGQKDRIYFAYIEKIIPILPGKYEFGRSEEGLMIIKR